MTIDLPMAAVLGVPAALAAWWLGLRSVEIRVSELRASRALPSQAQTLCQIAEAYERSPHTVGPQLAELAQIGEQIAHVVSVGGRPHRRVVSRRDALIEQILSGAVPEYRRAREEAGL